MIVWRRMKLHSVSSSGPGLFRIASGIAILPTSCSSAARATSSSSSAVMPSSRPTAERQLGASAQVRVRGRARARTACCSSTSRDWRPADMRRPPFCAYMRRSASWSASVACAPPSGASTAPCEASTEKPSPCSRQRRRRRPARSGSTPAAPGCEQHAELVAAEPVGAAVAAHGVPASRSPRRASSPSPAGWPKVSLYCLKPSRSNSTSARGSLGVASASSSRRGRPSGCGGCGGR